MAEIINKGRMHPLVGCVWWMPSRGLVRAGNGRRAPTRIDPSFGGTPDSRAVGSGDATVPEPVLLAGRLGEGIGGCGWGVPQPGFESPFRGQRWFLIDGCSELLPIMVVVQPGGGPVLCGGMSRRRWVGLSGSIRNPIWWMATWW